MKRINTGGLPFSELRENGDYYYVDKSLLIKDVLDYDDRGIYLFTRPRRFGKTTNLSMLDAFFNLKYKGNTWFDNLEISKYPEYDQYRNAFPVIHVDLRPANMDSYKEFVDGIQTAMLKAFNEHDYLLDDDDPDDTIGYIYRSLKTWSVGAVPLMSSLALLSSALEKYHKKKVILLIDEYDCAVSDAFGTKEQRPMLKFLRQFLGQALKGNSSLQMAYVTGVMQIAKESIFSELNNIKVNNIFSIASDERFGFTENEVKDLLSYYGHPDKMDEVREWYDGYRFGNVDVYNPFSIMNYIQDGCDPQPYWVNSGGNWVVKELLQKIDDDNMNTIISLTTGQTATVELDSSLAFGDVSPSDSTLFSLMAMSGYLNAVPVEDGDYDISIPNKEIMKMVDDLVNELNPIATSDFVSFNQAVLDGDADRMTAVLEKILMDGSYMNLRENAYEMIVMTILHGLAKRYDVHTEYEAGYGRTDIILNPRNEGRSAMIMELKVVEKKEDLDDGLKEAMDQIHDRKYYLGMSGKVVLVAMSFWNKVPKVRTDIISVRA